MRPESEYHLKSDILQPENKPGVTGPGRQKANKLFFGWIILIACVVVCVITYCVLYSFGVFFKPLQEEFNWSRAMTSGAFSLFLFSHGVFGLLAGWAADRFGTRKVIAAAGFCIGMGLFMSSKTNAVWQLYVYYGLLLGFGIAGIWTPLIMAVTRWFIHRRGIALGIMAAGVGIGLMLSGPVSGILIDSYGWRGSYLIMGIAAWVLVIGGSYFIVAKPEQRGLTPYQKIDIKSTQGAQPAIGTISPKSMTMKEALKTRYLWLLYGMQMLIAFALQMIMAHIVNHATDMGIDKTSARLLLTLIGAVSIGGKLASGYLSDVIGPRRMFFISSFGKGLILLVLIKSNSIGMFYLCAIFFGLFYGGWVPLFPALTTEFFGSKHMGIIYGSLIMTVGFAAPLGPWVAGYLFDHTQTYSVAFLIAAIASFGAAGLCLLLGSKKTYKEAA